jgi:hypothetical protein
LFVSGSEWSNIVQYAKVETMEKRKITPEFNVAQAIGSMAIEGIRVSDETRDLMLRVARGELSGAAARQDILRRYGVSSPQ